MKKINNKTKIKILPIIITIVVVGLLSLIPYTFNKSLEEEEIVEIKDEFKLDKMTYQIPTGFEYSKLKDENYRSYSFSSDCSYCHIDIEKYASEYNQSNSGEEYLKRTLRVTLQDEVETKKDGDWFIVTVTEPDNSIRKVASIKHGKAIYTIDYNFSDYANGENEDSYGYKTCVEAFEYVYNSVGFKK